MKFDNMPQALEYMKKEFAPFSLEYTSGSYSCGLNGTTRWIAEYWNSGIEIRSEEHCTGTNIPMINLSNRVVAGMAFFKLKQDKKIDAALQLTAYLLRLKSITLCIGSTDWEIKDALNYCGASLPAGVGYTAYFNFEGQTRIPRGHYQSLQRELYN